MMMGHKDRSFHPLPRVSLEDLVPADHFYRYLEAKEWHGMRRFRLRRLKRVNAEPCWWRRDRTSRAPGRKLGEEAVAGGCCRLAPGIPMTARGSG
jgi:hypothetical protein